jgi:hypothetical protein
MTGSPLRIVWAVALLLLAAAGYRASRLPDPYAAGASVGRVEDRREHRFRDLTYTETQRLFEKLLATATRAPDAATRGRALARIAALQRERGLEEAAQAAATEALRFAPHDPEVQRLLQSPLDPARIR